MYIIIRMASNLIYVKYVRTGHDISKLLGNLENPVAPENIFCVQESMWATIAKGHLQDRFIESPKDYMLVLNADKFFAELKSL